MSKAPFPSDQQDKFMLRLPDGMRERIKAAAEANNRSMNSEIVATLDEKYPVPVRDLTLWEVDEMIAYALAAPTVEGVYDRVDELNERLNSTGAMLLIRPGQNGLATIVLQSRASDGEQFKKLTRAATDEYLAMSDDERASYLAAEAAQMAKRQGGQ